MTIKSKAASVTFKSVVKAYGDVRIGNPLDADTLMGPLVTPGAVVDMQNAIERIHKEGGEVLYGGETLNGPVRVRRVARGKPRVGEEASESTRS